MDSNKEVIDQIEEQPNLDNPSRHPFVTFWLYLIITANSVVTLFYLFGSDSISRMSRGQIEPEGLMFLGFLSAFNILFGLMIVRWKKSGFWGLLVITILVAIFNSFLYKDLNVLGVVGIVILYAVLQIKHHGRTAWSLLK